MWGKLRARTVSAVSHSETQTLKHTDMNRNHATQSGSMSSADFPSGYDNNQNKNLHRKKLQWNTQTHTQKIHQHADCGNSL